MLGELSRLSASSAGKRLQIFRECLSRNICLASPMLLRACRPDELDEAVWGLRPPHGWPLHGRIRIKVRGLEGRHSRHGPVGYLIDDERTGQRIEIMDQVALRLSWRMAHMTLKVGEAVVSTKDDGGQLSIPRALGPSEGRALEGRPVESVIDHPALAGATYTITGARPGLIPSRSLIDFAAAPEEWRVPWRRPWELPF